MSHFVKLFASFFLLACISPGVFAAGKHIAMYTTTGDFSDIKERVVSEIEGRGMVINNVAHIGEMLERTGKELGATKLIYKHAEALEFCSATVSRKMMEPDPHNIVFCPYIIAVYVLPQEPKKVYVSFRKPDRVGTAKSKEALKAVEKLLDEIIRDALQ